MSAASATGTSLRSGPISARNLLIAQFFAGILALVATAAGLPVWAGIIVGVALGAVGLIPVRRHVLLDWLTTWWRFRKHRQFVLGQLHDYRDPDNLSLGLFWDGTRVVSVVEVGQSKGGLTRIGRSAVEASDLLPLTALARSLTQHDIALTGIDVISHGHRSRAGTPAGHIYESLLGPLPATAHRTVWLAIGFDSVQCPGAVARRGGGAEGTQRSITVATRRIVRTLQEHGCTARTLTAAEIGSAVAQITASAHSGDLPPTVADEPLTDEDLPTRDELPRQLPDHWRGVELGNNINIGSALDPKRLNAETLASLWVPASRGTTVALRLRPGATADRARIGAAWRRTSREMPDSTDTPGSILVHGRHREALLAHLPIGVPGLEDVIPLVERPIDEIDALRMPSAGCGQLIGSDDAGNGVAVRIIGAGISTVYVAGELYLAHQLVFRALAIGERILVRTDRPAAWQKLVESIGDQHRLLVAAQVHQSDAGFTGVVVDGVLAPGPHAGITTIYVAGDRRGWPVGPAELTIEQPGAIGTRVILRSGNRREDLQLVTIPSEKPYIQQPRPGRTPAPAR